MSDISIDENKKLRVLNPSIFQESELVAIYSNEFITQVQLFVESNQVNFNKVQQQVNLLEQKRAMVIGYRLLAELERIKRSTLEIQFKESLQDSQLQLEAQMQQLNHYKEG